MKAYVIQRVGDEDGGQYVIGASMNKTWLEKIVLDHNRETGLHADRWDLLEVELDDIDAEIGYVI